MATYLENLQTRRDAIATELAALDSTKAGGRPDSPAGIRHQAYKDSLIAEMEKILNLIEKAKEVAADDAGPWEEFTQYMPE